MVPMHFNVKGGVRNVKVFSCYEQSVLGYAMINIDELCFLMLIHLNFAVDTSKFRRKSSQKIEDLWPEDYRPQEILGKCSGNDNIVSST